MQPSSGALSGALTRALVAAVSDAERELNGSGRVLIRPSGTEPVLRVMVEASEAEIAEAMAQRLASTLRPRAIRPVELAAPRHCFAKSAPSRASRACDHWSGHCHRTVTRRS